MKSLIFLFLFFFATSYSFAYEDANVLENQYLLQLQESRDASLVMKNGSKYYVNPERVLISQEGSIFLNTDLYGTLSLRCLMSDNDGLHTLGFVVYICNSCGASYSTQPSSCTRIVDKKTGEKCGGSSFTVTGMMPD